ncbi:MAG: amidase [Rhodoferax sp.]|uniref:amidase n=1 Tax=Rhodoferax sp. TaxID=50421 RepID=UPI002620613B|nr:amidase [Rhodoferax sp.]MDD5335135.1 amidase [Rhodoferax sp.]
MSVTELTAHALSLAIHAREISCREAMQAYLRRIADLNPRYNALVSLQDGDQLLRQAAERDAQLARGQSMGWLHGLPLAIKDLANTAGIATTLGSPLMRNFVPQQDGLMVQRMKAAGGIVVGKTNTPEFGLGSHTFNEVFGVTRNAYEASRSAGGSSGGAAVALALHLLPVADGSDFMGSLRNPAGWNNVFGLRPSQGRVPLWPTPDVWVSQLGTEGPMGRSVRDVARLLAVQAGFDPRVPLSLADGVDFTRPLEGIDCKQLRIGWLADLAGYLPMEPGILAVCEQGLRRFENLGCAVQPMQLGTPPQAIWQAWLVWRRALVAARIAPFLLNPGNRALIKPEALWEADQARQLSGSEFLSASAQRTAFYQHMLGLFEQHDFLALPVAQVWPFDATQRWPEQINGVAMDTYHRWMEVVIYATFAGLPCISVPVGFDARGLPMGLQLIGKPRADFELLQLAHAYEQAAQEVLTRKPALV